jgi:crotonobetainyl-CoA:carnitine CoA-transferase CaiB-like acyl-CoA transferase
MTLPLDGIRVIEIGHSVAAPYAALVLAELGAEVVKIERPGAGDDARSWGDPVGDPAGGASPTFHALNRLKRSVTLDLKSADGGETLRRLAAVSDVVIQNQKPGLAAALGFDAGALRDINPRLIYANIHAFGDRGPLAGKPGYDPLMQAFGGLMSVTGHPGQPSVRVGPSIIDCGTGMWVVIGVLAALLRRAQTGRGATVDTALFETALGWMVYFVTILSATGRPPGKAGSGTVMICPYQIFQCADGELMIAAGNDTLFAKLCRTLGHPEWAADARFVHNPGRVANRRILIPLLEGQTAQRALAELSAALDAAGVPHAPVQDMAQVAAHPQTQAIGIKRGAGGLDFFGLPLRLDGARPARHAPAPALGEANDWLDDVLKAEATR